MPENEINKLKTKLRSTCEKYSNIKVPHTQGKIIPDLSNRDNIILLKQNKGQGVIVMDRSKFTEKCLEVLSTKQFTVVENDLTKTLESKIQSIIRKIKTKISDQENKDLYPTGSQPGKFYCTAKMQKLPINGNLNHLPLRPMVSNINTSTYDLAKTFSKLLSPIRQSDHNVRSTKDFTQNIKRENIPTGYKMVSFDVKLLFTNVPLDRTINIILKRIYYDNELRISISRNEMKELLLLCTKKVYFTFNGKINMQVDGVAIESPLGPVLADIFMIQLEKVILLELTECIKYWKRYVNDRISFVKFGSINYIITKLNSFDKNIQFSLEEEEK